MQFSVLAELSIGNQVRTLPARVARLDGIALWIAGGEHIIQSIVRYPSTDVGVGRLDDSGVGTPELHELDNMDPSVSGDPWYPLECICRRVVWWLLYAVHRAVFEVRRICFIRRVRKV